MAIEDDHQPFLKRGVASVDLIDFDGFQAYWHTPQDTLDKISARNLGIVGPRGAGVGGGVAEEEPLERRCAERNPRIGIVLNFPEPK
jgi:hypothetical protein